MPSHVVQPPNRDLLSPLLLRLVHSVFLKIDCRQVATPQLTDNFARPPQVLLRVLDTRDEITFSLGLGKPYTPRVLLGDRDIVSAL